MIGDFLFRILDPFTLTLITVVLLASFFPARGDFVPFFENLTTAAIALLFFMHGAKLSREAIIAGGGHWRLHLWVMCSTFVLFPILGVLFAWWKPVNVDPMLYSGFLYLCILPATVQSAIAFTSMAGGNVAAAVCSASASSLLGIFLVCFCGQIWQPACQSQFRLSGSRPCRYFELPFRGAAQLFRRGGMETLYRF